MHQWFYLLRGLTLASRRRVSGLIRLASALSHPGMPSRIPGKSAHTEDVGDALWRIIRTRDESHGAAQMISVAERLIGAAIAHTIAPLAVVSAAPTEDVDPRPGNYYVSVIRHGSSDYRLVAGPWPTHIEALRQVPAVKREVAHTYRVDPWDAWGTARTEEPAQAILPAVDYDALAQARDDSERAMQLKAVRPRKRLPLVPTAHK